MLGSTLAIVALTAAGRVCVLRGQNCEASTPCCNSSYTCVSHQAGTTSGRCLLPLAHSPRATSQPAKPVKAGLVDSPNIAPVNHTQPHMVHPNGISAHAVNHSYHYTARHQPARPGQRSSKAKIDGNNIVITSYSPACRPEFFETVEPSLLVLLTVGMVAGIGGLFLLVKLYEIHSSCGEDLAENVDEDHEMELCSCLRPGRLHALPHAIIAYWTTDDRVSARERTWERFSVRLLLVLFISFAIVCVIGDDHFAHPVWVPELAACRVARIDGYYVCPGWPHL